MENINFKITSRMALELEFVVYEIADMFCENYQGGEWKFCKEGMFWYPCDRIYRVINPNNYFDDEMTSRASGIAFCLMACSELSIRYHNRDTSFSEAWADYYFMLREFAFDSQNFNEKERRSIALFLD